MPLFEPHLSRLLDRPRGGLALYRARLGRFTRNVRLLLLGGLLSGMGLTFWQLLFNLYLQQAGWTKDAIGDMLALGNFAMAAVALPAGYFAGRARPKTQMIAAQTVSALGFGLAALADARALLMAAVAVGYAAGVFMRVAGGPFIMRNTTPVERTYVFSAFFVVMLAGGVLGNTVGGLLKDGLLAAGLAPLSAYRATILAGVGCSLAGLTPLFLIDASASLDADPPRLRLRDARRWEWGLFGRAIAPMVPLTVGAGLIVQFINLYIKDVFAASDGVIGLVMAAQALTMALGVLAGPPLAERFGKVRTIVLTQLASLPFMLALAFTDHFGLAVAALLIRAALMNMSGPLSNTLVLELCPKEQQGLLNALSIMVWSSAWGVSAWIFGRLLQGNYPACFLIASALYLASSLAYGLLFRRAEPRPPA